VVKLSGDYQKEVTWVICRKIKPGRQKDFDGWFEHYMTFQRKAPGYLGTTVIIPGGSKSSLRYVIHRFTNKAAKETWENSPELIKLQEDVNKYSEPYYDTATGLETWFALPNLRTQISVPTPPQWKMAIVVFIAAFPISWGSRSILNPFLEQWSLPGNTAIYTAILVASLTYFAMPILSRLLRQWLYANKSH
jgi:uncharacterized protein